MNSLIKSYRKAREELVKDNPRMEGVKREFVVEVDFGDRVKIIYKVGEEDINEVIEYTNGYVEKFPGRIIGWIVREDRRMDRG